MDPRVAYFCLFVATYIVLGSRDPNAAKYWRHIETKNKTSLDEEPEWLVNLRKKIAAKGRRKIPAPKPSRYSPEADGAKPRDYWRATEARNAVPTGRPGWQTDLRSRIATEGHRVVPPPRPYGPPQSNEGVDPRDYWRALEAKNVIPAEKPKWLVDLQNKIATKGRRVIRPQRPEVPPSWTKRRTDGNSYEGKNYDDPLFHRPKVSDFKAPWQEEWEGRSRRRSDQEYALGDTYVGKTALPSTGQSYHQMAKNPTQEIYIGSERDGGAPKYEDYGPDTRRLGDIYDPTQKLEAIEQRPQKKEIRDYEPENPRKMHDVHDYQKLYSMTDDDYKQLSLEEIENIVSEQLN